LLNQPAIHRDCAVLEAREMNLAQGITKINRDRVAKRPGVLPGECGQPSHIMTVKHGVKSALAARLPLDDDPWCAARVASSARIPRLKADHGAITVAFMKCPALTALALASCVALAAAAPVERPATIDERTLSEWMELILPKADEGDWQAVPWRTAFWESVEEAQAAEKPILLWAMNGHPLACT